MSPDGLSPTPDPVAAAEAELVAAQAHLEEALRPQDAAALDQAVAAVFGAPAVVAPALDLSDSPRPEDPAAAPVAPVRVRWLPDAQQGYPQEHAGRWWQPGSVYALSPAEAAPLLALPFFSTAPDAAGG